MNQKTTKWMVCLCVVLFAWNQGFAEIPGVKDDGEQSRAAVLENLRLERQKDVKPETYPKALYLLESIENDGWDQFVTVQHKQFRFGFGQISPISGLTPALRWERPHLGGSRLIKSHLSAAVSITGYQAYIYHFGKFDELAPHDLLGSPFLGAPFNFDPRDPELPQTFLYTQLAYRNFPRERFYGTGFKSSKDDRVDYRLEVGDAGLIAGHQIRRWLAVLGDIHYLKMNVGPGTDDNHPDLLERFDESTVPGAEKQTDFLHAKAGVFIGHGGDPNYPAYQVGVNLGRWHDLNDLGHSFNRYSLDLRGFFPLGTRVRTLAFRYYASKDDPGEDGAVPFYVMQTMGGQYMLRGFQNYRFRDARQMYASAEYRWEANASTDLALFYEWGKVFDENGHFNFDDGETTYGMGIRFKNYRRVVFRIDVGHSDAEGTFTHISAGPSF